jgi:hypothetical protein
MFLATYWKISFKSGDLEKNSSKSNEELLVEGSVSFYGLTIQEETRRDNSHQ